MNLMQSKIAAAVSCFQQNKLGETHYTLSNSRAERRN